VLRLNFGKRNVSATNTAELGKGLLQKIDALDQSLNRYGPKGLSLLVGSKNIVDDNAVAAKLSEIDAILRSKDDERGRVKSNAEMATGLLLSGRGQDGNQSKV